MSPVGGVWGSQPVGGWDSTRSPPYGMSEPRAKWPGGVAGARASQVVECGSEITGSAG